MFLRNVFKNMFSSYYVTGDWQVKAVVTMEFKLLIGSVFISGPFMIKEKRQDMDIFIIIIIPSS